ncbi:MAG: type II toxin-antitoxin system RelE/ParE family toxin [Desulfobulbaceae bacterium]
MAELRWTREAEQWLKDIHEYIARENQVAAGKVVTGIYNKAQLVRDFPDLGHKYRSEPEGDVRIVYYGHYRIVYLSRTEGVIDILGVFHGALDIERYFP